MAQNEYHIIISNVPGRFATRNVLRQSSGPTSFVKHNCKALTPLMHDAIRSGINTFGTFRSIFAITLPLVRSNSWDAQLAVPNDLRYARLETNLGIGQAKEG
ncbi:hypothetical protein TNCV_1203921 [Trichonephila clavipes]|nr:hypothetical protein TNCV_1203921 [Trichonephila clavipes]